MKNGVSAFPVLDSATDYDGENPRLECIDEGMSLRDWFAGQIVSASMAGRDTLLFSKNDANKYAKEAYLLADAMLEARDKTV
jgi:hypothetical protein